MEEELERLLSRAEERKQRAQKMAEEILKLEEELDRLAQAQEAASQKTTEMNERFRQLTDDITQAQSVEIERKADRARYVKQKRKTKKKNKKGNHFFIF
jgi:cell division septum initiation protein DivIVA